MLDVPAADRDRVRDRARTHAGTTSLATCSRGTAGASSTPRPSPQTRTPSVATSRARGRSSPSPRAPTSRREAGGSASARLAISPRDARRSCRTPASRERCPWVRACSRSGRSRTRSRARTHRRGLRESPRCRTPDRRGVLRLGRDPRSPARGRDMSRAICVLGMMRTGTSAVAGVLELLGVHFGPDGAPARAQRRESHRVSRAQGDPRPEQRAARPARRHVVRAARARGRLGGRSRARGPARTRRQARRVGSRTARRLGMEGPAHLSHAALLAGARAGSPPRCLPSGARRDRAVVRGAGRDGLDGCPASARPVRDGPRSVAPLHQRCARADTRTSATPRVLRRAGRGSARTERPARGLHGTCPGV